MSCDIKINSPIYRVIYTSLLEKKKKIYIFVGNIKDSGIKKILKKVKSGENLLKQEIIKLKNSGIEDLYRVIYPYTTKLKIDEEIEIIYRRIRNDDTISEIKKIIFVSVSDFENQKFITINNQCLWMERENNKVKILGLFYEGKDINPKDIYKKKVKIDKSFIKDDGRMKKLEVVSNNDELIGNLVDECKIAKNKIYMLNGQDIYDFMVSKGINVIRKIKNGFLKKYFPRFDILPITKSIELYDKILARTNYKNYVFNILDDIKIPVEGVKNCLITTIKLNTVKKEICNFYGEENIQVDLYKIFYYLSTNKSIDYSKMPLVKYKNQKEKINKIFIWKNLKKMIGINMIKSWVNLKKKGRNFVLKQSTTSVQIKRFYKKINNIPIFYTLILWDKGNVTAQISFRENYDSSFKDIQYLCDDIKEVLDNINKNVKLTRKFKFNFIAPKLIYANSMVKLDKFTNIDYFNSTTFFNFNKKVNLKELAKFLENFNFMVNYKRDKNVVINSINLKYKRVSNYVNMSDIMYFIDEKKKEGMDDIEILKEISESCDKTDKESDKLLKKWKIEYGLVKKKENEKYNTGASLDIYEKKFAISGIKDVKLLKRIYNFCGRIIYIFLNQDKYKRGFKIEDFAGKNVSLKDIEDDLDDRELGLGDFDKNVNVNNYNYDDFGGVNNYNFGNEDEETKEYIEDELNKESVLENKKPENIKEELEFNETQMESQLRLEVVCKDDEKGPDYEHETCGDLCNDNKYFLRRLQKYNPELYYYKLKKSNKKTDDSQYSRSCQSGFKQPVILDYDPKERKDIDQTAFKNVIHFPSSDRDLFYICPDAWCPYHQKPVSRSSIPNIQIKQGVNGACIVAECPYGDHNLYVKKPFNLKKDKDEYYNYVGFIDKSKTSHPDGTCQVCCYKKDQSLPSSAKYDNYKICLGENVEEKDDLDDNIYLLSSTTMPLRMNRYGVLPESLLDILGYKCQGGYIEDKRCFIRKGIKQNSDQSFLYCFADLFYPVKPVNMSKFKKALVNTPAFTEKLFKSLNNGMLAQKFHNPKTNQSAFENYKQYILGSTHTISYEYLWDLLQRPKIILETGCNIIIFRKRSTICPYYEDVDQYYDVNRPTIMLYTNGLYYEPIFLANGKLSKKDYTWIFHKDNFSRITEIIENIKENCKHYYDIDIAKILEDTEAKEGIKLLDNLSFRTAPLDKTLDRLKGLKKGYELDFQVLDFNFKVPGIFLKNGLYLPIRPSRLDTEIEYEASDSDKIKYLNYKDTLEGLNYLKKNNFNTKPIYKILDLHRKKIIGIITETARKVQVEQSPLVNDSLKTIDISFYSNINRAIHDEVELYDERKEYIMKKVYEDENFNRIVFEISNYLNESNNKKVKDEINELISSKDSLSKKREKLKNILNKLVKRIVLFENISFNILDYVRPNKRTPCYKSKDCFDKFHCKKVGSKCMLLVGKNNLITGKLNKETYISMLIEDLLRYEQKRIDILDNLIDNIIDKDNIKVSSELLDFSILNPKKLNEEVEQYFADKKSIFVSDKKLYDEIESEDFNVEKEKFAKFKEDNEIEIYLKQLPTIWEYYLDGFEVYDPPEKSIFDVIRNILFFRNKKDDTISVEATNKIRDNLVEKLKELDYKKLNEYNNILKLINRKITKKDNLEHIKLNIYNQLNEGIYSKTDIIENIFKDIKDRSYTGNVFDIFLLAEIYKLNIVLLLNRKSKNVNHFYIKPLSKKVNETVLVLRGNIDLRKRKKYNSVINKDKHGFNFIFDNKNLPEDFLIYLEKLKSSKIDLDEDDEDGNNNKK